MRQRCSSVTTYEGREYQCRGNAMGAGVPCTARGALGHGHIYWSKLITLTWREGEVPVRVVPPVAQPAAGGVP